MIAVSLAVVFASGLLTDQQRITSSGFFKTFHLKFPQNQSIQTGLKLIQPILNKKVDIFSYLLFQWLAILIINY
jgi:hypothetical protein